jgi:aminoglycoside phosphotransferase (APT) family kinase protein
VPAAHRAAVERFLATRPPSPPRTLVFSHNDLGVENVLVEASDDGVPRVSGVIDWSDAALVEPACDLGRVLRDLGATGLAAALAALSSDEPGPDEPTGSREAVTGRAWFYARCLVLEDLAFGLDTGHDAYRRKALRALGRLFPG